MKKESKAKETVDISFEKALERLELIVEKMESGKLQLDEMMKYFEEGSSLSAICEKKLKDLEKKIEILVKNGQDGKWKNFSSSSENDDSAESGAKDKDSLL